MLKDLSRIYEYREMVKNSVRKELRGRYKGSILGFFWTFLNPLLTLVVYTIVFASIMKVNVPDHSYAIFLFVGLIPWTYFSATVQQSTTTIIANSNLIKKIYFPRIILPISVTATNLVNMLLTFIIVFAAVWIFDSGINLLYLYLPIIIIIETILALGFSVILSSVTVYFRDMEHIFSIIMMAWFYFTPIIYPNEYIPSSLLLLFRINPMMPLIEAYRDVLMFNKIPDTMGLLYVLLFSIGLLTIGYYIFNSLQKRFAEEI